MKITRENLAKIIKEEIEKFTLSEASMAEYGKIDAEDRNPPSKIGRGNSEYMKAYNAVLVARGEEPLDIVKPDQAYLDALRSGRLEEEAENPVNEERGFTNLDEDVYSGLDNVLQLVRASETLDPNLKEELEMGILNLIDKLDKNVMPYEKRRYNI